MIVGYVIFLTVCIVYYRYMARQRPTASDADKAAWKLYILTLCFGVYLLFASLYLVPTSSSPSISSEDSLEKKVQELNEKARRDTELLNQSRRASEYTLFGVGFYLICLAGLIAKIHKKRNADLLRENPELKKPLGL